MLTIKSKTANRNKKRAAQRFLPAFLTTLIWLLRRVPARLEAHVGEVLGQRVLSLPRRPGQRQGVAAAGLVVVGAFIALGDAVNSAIYQLEQAVLSG